MKSKAGRCIVQTARQIGLNQVLNRVADVRWSRILATGETVPWNDAKAWLEVRSRGEHPLRPAARKPGR